MEALQLPNVTIYTDGACNPNPGPGGWAAILLYPGQKPQEMFGSVNQATNNRMELMAAIKALQSLTEPHEVSLHTDSEYLQHGITDWLIQWEKRGWKTAEKKPVKNKDLWQQLSAEMSRHQVDWQWIRGHAGDPWNERADLLATSVIPKSPLPLDDRNAIHVFTAASYLGNVKRGGWSVVLRFHEKVKILSGNARNTSGNRMHIQSAVEGLKAVKKPMPVHLYTTSDYLKDGATLWLTAWANRNWKTKEGTPVSHRDLWEELAGLLNKMPVSWHVVDKDSMPREMTQAKELAGEAARTK
jgi:ribonuclease HI